MTSVPITTHELRIWLEQLFPAFSQRLAESMFGDESGKLTAHGLFAEFSHFYREGGVDVSSPVTAELFGVVEAVVAADPADNDVLANAICTCLLENLSSTQIGEASRPLMGPTSRAYFDRWRVASDE